MDSKKEIIGAHRRDIVQWARDAIDASGLSQTKVAQLMGFDRASLNKSLKGHRPFKYDEVAKLAQVLNIQAPQHLQVADAGTVVKTVQLVGSLAAGVWRERGEMAKQQITFSIVPNKKEFDHLQSYADFVEDNHADLYVPKGYYVIWVDYAFARQRPVVGDKVIVERTRVVGTRRATERSIREITLSPEGKFHLASLCSDKDYLEPIPYQTDTATLKVCGLIIARHAEG